MKPTLIIDCHAICHAVKHTIGDLSHDEQKVGIVFGFMKQLLSLSKYFDTNQFVFAWDSKQSLRKQLYPQYKTRRKLSQDDYQFERFAFQQFTELRMVTIPMFGFKNSFIQTGYEADDIIAVVVQTYPDQDFVIVSGDNDLYQLLRVNVAMYSTKAKKLTTEQSFSNEWGISPKKWSYIKQIAGCVSDTVAGIRGVGNKTAVKYLLNTLGQKTKAYQRIETGQDIILRNEPLVKLPFSGTNPVQLQQEQFQVADFIALTDKYGFKSFQQIASLNEWITHFAMH